MVSIAGPGGFRRGGPAARGSTIGDKHQVQRVGLCEEADNRCVVEAIALFAPDVVGVSVRNIDNTDRRKSSSQPAASPAACPIRSITLSHLNSSPTVLLPPTSNNFIEPQWKTKHNCTQSPLWKPETTGGDSFPVLHNPQF